MIRKQATLAKEWLARLNLAPILFAVVACVAVFFVLWLLQPKSAPVAFELPKRRELPFFEDDEIAYTQARIKAKPDCTGSIPCKIRFCEALPPSKCGPKYLLPGDVILVEPRTAQFVSVDYVSSEGKWSGGWVDSKEIEYISDDYGRSPDWSGNWTSGDTFIDIRATAAKGLFIAIGEGTFGLDDPKRARRGGISVGSFLAKFFVKDHRAAFAPDRGDGGTINERNFKLRGDEMHTLKTHPYGYFVDNNCNVKLHRIGIYLVAYDNGHCGGEHFSFYGVYRKRTS